MFFIPALGNAKAYVPQNQPTREVIALTLLMESRGEGVLGIDAVSRNIQNRSAIRHLSLKQVCLQPKQYSCWNKGITHSKAVELFYGSQGLHCLNLADKMISGTLTDSKIGNAEYYHAKGCSPKWAKSMVLVATIGNHLFY